MEQKMKDIKIVACILATVMMIPALATVMIVQADQGQHQGYQPNGTFELPTGQDNNPYGTFIRGDETFFFQHDSLPPGSDSGYAGCSEALNEELYTNAILYGTQKSQSHRQDTTADVASMLIYL
jgi:hypothetical protein